MKYDGMTIDSLVRLLVEKKLDSASAYDHESNALGDKLAEETGEIGEAIVAHGDAGAAALRPLLADPREPVQFVSAAWLSELDPYGAAPTLERLVREAEDPAIKGFARLKLHNNRERGLLPAR